MCGSKLQNKRRLNFAYRLTTLSHADAQELEQQQQKSLMVKKVKKNKTCKIIYAMSFFIAAWTKEAVVSESLILFITLFLL